MLGLGLLGGSVARAAARRRGAAGRVVGATRRRGVLEAAMRQGVVDAVGSPEEAVRDADLVVLATPVFAMAETVRQVAPHLREGATVTDVGSVKAVLHETLPGLLPRGVRYIGSHPMAGSHERGFEHSRADLFEGAAVHRHGDCGLAGTGPSLRFLAGPGSAGRAARSRRSRRRSGLDESRSRTSWPTPSRNRWPRRPKGRARSPDRDSATSRASPAVSPRCGATS